jgi:Concanavalin A-like lectin/glucanases superfamily
LQVAGKDLPISESGTPPSGEAYRDAVLADGPIAYFRFDEMSGTSAKNEIAGSLVTAVYPASGVTLGAEGINASSRSVRLDLASAPVNVFNATSFVGEQPFTIEAWFLVDAAATKVQLFTNMDNEGDGSTRTGQWMLLSPSGVITTETWAAGAHIFFTKGPTQVPSGAWHHVVFLHSDALQKDVLYVNGGDGSGGRLGAGARVAATSPLSFKGFTGRVDEVAIYAKVLPPDRIAAHYAAR